MGFVATDSFLDRRLSSVFDKKTATALASLDLARVRDLMYHLPRRYVTRQNLSNLGQGEIGDHVTVVARVVKATPLRSRDGRKQMVKVIISDGDHSLELTFFAPHQGRVQYYLSTLTPGTRAMFDGKLGEFRNTKQLVNPKFELLQSTDDDATVAARLPTVIPIYPASAKASSWTIHRAIQVLLPQVDDAELPEALPPDLVAGNNWPSPLQCLTFKHTPDAMAQVQAADDRLRFEEAFVLQTALARRRAQADALPAVARPASEGGLLAAFDATLPFTLTTGQQEVGAQIAADLARSHPMHRLLQGEVGSGKTIVALRAMLTVVDAGGQAALLAPTEVLATQHHRSITAMLGNLATAGMLPLAGPVLDGVVGTQVALLTGSQSTRARREALLAAASGQAGIVVGTHALLQDTVQFADLGLVVVDEQQRFGVEQRDALRAKAVHTPHLLVMTATPIPRTVAMTIFGDLDTSTLRELPRGRQPIASHVVPQARPSWVQRTWQVVKQEVDAGRQAFVVCPAIETTKGAAVGEDDGGLLLDPDQDGKGPPRVTVTEMMARLAGEPELAGVRLAMLHGRMPAEEKDATMSAFAAGEVDVLVATTVIEVGVDVPNASVMVVMDAHQFGISQLHQLRGRIGRGQHPGYCFFVVPEGVGEQAGELLEGVAGTADGFELARLDLAQRREGDVLGAAQSGMMSSLRVLRVTEDEDVIVEARALANRVVADDPDLARHPALADAIESLLNPEREVFLERG